jgi:hypothetical protein
MDTTANEEPSERNERKPIGAQSNKNPMPKWFLEKSSNTVSCNIERWVDAVPIQSSKERAISGRLWFIYP